MKRIPLFLALLLLLVLSSCGLWRTSRENDKSQDSDFILEPSVSTGEGGTTPPLSDGEPVDDDFSNEETVFSEEEQGEGIVEDGMFLCGYIEGIRQDCPDLMMCATVSWKSEPFIPKCYSRNICSKSPCEPDEVCTVVKSWPSRVFCYSPDRLSELNETGGQLIMECPDEWVINHSPAEITGEAGRKTSDEYFLLGGKRKEIDEFSMDYVRENCELQPKELN